jgi:hypothetical protein
LRHGDKCGGRLHVRLAIPAISSLDDAIHTERLLLEK